MTIVNDLPRSDETDDPILNLRSLGTTVDARHRRTKAILLAAIRDRASVTDEDLTLAARWIWGSMRGDESRPFNFPRRLEECGLTQRDIARSLGIHKKTVWDWFHGNKRPSVEMAKRLAPILKMPPYRLIHSFASRTNPSTSPTVRPPYNPDLPLAGQNFAAARIALGLTQDGLAQKAGLESHWAVRAYEAGKTVPSESFQKCQEALRREFVKQRQNAISREKRRQRRALRSEQDSAGS